MWCGVLGWSGVWWLTDEPRDTFRVQLEAHRGFEANGRLAVLCTQGMGAVHTRRKKYRRLHHNNRPCPTTQRRKDITQTHIRTRTQNAYTHAHTQNEGESKKNIIFFRLSGPDCLTVSSVSVTVPQNNSRVGQKGSYGHICGQILGKVMLPYYQLH